MKTLMRLFWQLCLFQRGPEDVPHSPPLVAVLVAALMLLSVLIVVLFEPLYVVEKLMGSVLALLAWFALLSLLLKFKELGNRLLQTMAACLGTDLVISLISVPLQLAVMSATAETQLGTVSRFGLLSLMIWDILVKGHIYSGALNISRLQGNFLSISIWIIMLLISYQFIPEALQQNPQ